MNLQELTRQKIFGNPRGSIAPKLQCHNGCADLKEIFINGSELSVLERGKGEPVVFVHGPLADYRAWHKQLEFLAARYRVISYSRRDHYPNSIVDNPGEYQPTTHVADLAALIEQLEISPVHLVGRSQGGAIAALLTDQRPELVRSLTLAEPWLFSVLTDHNDKVAMGFLRIALDVVRKMADADELNLALGEFVRIAYGREMLSDLPDWVQVMFNQNSHTLRPTLVTHFETAGFTYSSARRLTCPVLLINGDLSPRLNLAICQELNSAIPNSQMRTLTGSSHGLQLDNPADFNDTLSDFLAGLDPRGVN